MDVEAIISGLEELDRAYLARIEAALSTGYRALSGCPGQRGWLRTSRSLAW